MRPELVPPAGRAPAGRRLSLVLAAPRRRPSAVPYLVRACLRFCERARGHPRPRRARPVPQAAVKPEEAQRSGHLGVTLHRWDVGRWPTVGNAASELVT